MEEVEKPAAKGKNFKLRLLTSVFYVVIWIALCSLKWMVPGGWGDLGFDVLFCVISIVGSIEFLNAVGGVSLPQRATTIAFSAVIVPLHVIVQMTMSSGLLAVACAFFVYMMFLMAESVFDPHNSTVKGTINCVFCMMYCGILSAILSSINHLPYNSMAAILLLFCATVFTDTGAFLIGTLFKRFIPLKLSPKLSPNKTVIGAIGGLIGGVLAGVVSFVMIYYLGGLNGTIIFAGYNGVDLTFTLRMAPIAAFILIGFVTSILAQIGDLFESAIKRECGIKDMGNCLPGHGGILDRFDSMLYCSVVILLCFGTIIM